MAADAQLGQGPQSRQKVNKTRSSDVTRHFETTLGDLICALMEAAHEVSTDAGEIERLAFEALASLMRRQAVS